MKKVLCPTDFSEIANQAITYSAKLSKEIGAQLTLLNVPSIFSIPPKEVIKGKYLVTKQIRDRLEEQSYEVSKSFGITCFTDVKPSNINLVDLIAQKATDFDLVIMGTNGADDDYEFIFGSRSYRVAKSTSIPVLLLPNGCRYKNISSIVYAFDYEQQNRLPMHELGEWAKIWGANIIVLQVKGSYKPEVEKKSRELQKKIRNNVESSDVLFETIYSPEVNKCIESYVRLNDIDVLALCSIPHGITTSLFHKGTIKGLSSIANFPMFVFHN